MDCPRCGGALQSMDRYCPHCGVFIEDLTMSFAPLTGDSASQEASEEDKDERVRELMRKSSELSRSFTAVHQWTMDLIVNQSIPVSYGDVDAPEQHRSRDLRPALLPPDSSVPQSRPRSQAQRQSPWETEVNWKQEAELEEGPIWPEESSEDGVSKDASFATEGEPAPRHRQSAGQSTPKHTRKAGPIQVPSVEEPTREPTPAPVAREQASADSTPSHEVRQPVQPAHGFESQTASPLRQHVGEEARYTPRQAWRAPDPVVPASRQVPPAPDRSTPLSPVSTGAMPFVGTGISPAMTTGSISPTATGSIIIPHANALSPSATGSLSPMGTGSMRPTATGSFSPVGGTGSMPQMGTGAMPAMGTGAFRPVVAGTMPSAGTGTMPPPGTGAMPPMGTGAMPPSGTGAFRAGGTGAIDFGSDLPPMNRESFHADRLTSQFFDDGHDKDFAPREFSGLDDNPMEDWLKNRAQGLNDFVHKDWKGIVGAKLENVRSVDWAGMVKSPITKRVAIVVFSLLAIVFIATTVNSCVSRNAERERLEAEQSAQLEAEATERRLMSTLQLVDVSLVITGGDAMHLSPVALRVTGTTQTGDLVNELKLVKASDPKLMLLPGVYIVTVGGNPVSDDGILFQGSVDTYSVVVEATKPVLPFLSGSDSDSSSDAAAASSTSSTPVFVFTRVEPENVTDADIDAVRAWMTEAQLPTIGTYVDVLSARRKKVQDEKASEEAAKERERKRQEEEAAKALEEQLNASRQTSNSFFSFTLPPSWQGQVDVNSTTDASGMPVVIMTLAGNSKAELARVSYMTGAGAANTGGLEQHVVLSKPSSSGTAHAEVRTYNWPYIAGQGSAQWYADVTEAELEKLVLLSTGGTLTYAEAINGARDTHVVQAERAFTETAFASLVVY